MILFLKILLQLSLDTTLILESEFDIKKLISNKLKHYNCKKKIKYVYLYYY